MSSIYDPTGSGETAYDEPMTGPLDPEQRQGIRDGGRHHVNITQLVMGVAFAGFLVVWALVVGDVVDGEDDRWLWPIPWLVAGAVGLAATVLPSRK